MSQAGSVLVLHRKAMANSKVRSCVIHLGTTLFGQTSLCVCSTAFWAYTLDQTNNHRTEGLEPQQKVLFNLIFRVSLNQKDEEILVKSNKK